MPATMVTVIMPQLGMTMQEGTINRWFAAEGAFVTKGLPILEVTMDKGSVDVESPATGILIKVFRHAGDVVPVAESIGLIEEHDGVKE